MICSSEKRFFTSNLLGVGNWTPNQGATQNRGDVGSQSEEKFLSPRQNPMVGGTASVAPSAGRVDYDREDACAGCGLWWAIRQAAAAG
ncbi:hypothetical protein EYC55_00495 [Xanthomonas oryzae]|nr:hypothetical protein EYC55_00495 [Xanthomonas oryzae]QBG98226.1 hypothetical protein EYC56_00505 [Xanthomonas oryzae]